MWIGGVIPHYSPGLHCPDKYTTAGIAVKDGDGKLVSSSGLFAPATYGTTTIGPGPITYTSTEPGYHVYSSSVPASSTTITTTFAPTYNPYWNVFMEALGPSETAVACCPSGYTANFGGGCYSNVPNSMYAATTECEERYIEEASNTDYGNTTANVAFVYAGATVTGIQEIQAASTIAVSTTTEYEPTSTYYKNYTGVVFAPMAMLVQKGSDNAGSRTMSGGRAMWLAPLTVAALVGLR